MILHPKTVGKCHHLVKEGFPLTMPKRVLGYRQFYLPILKYFRLYILKIGIRLFVDPLKIFQKV